MRNFKVLVAMATLLWPLHSFSQDSTGKARKRPGNYFYANAGYGVNLFNRNKVADWKYSNNPNLYLSAGWNFDYYNRLELSLYGMAESLALGPYPRDSNNIVVTPTFISGIAMATYQRWAAVGPVSIGIFAGVGAKVIGLEQVRYSVSTTGNADSNYFFIGERPNAFKTRAIGIYQLGAEARTRLGARVDAMARFTVMGDIGDGLTYDSYQVAINSTYAKGIRTAEFQQKAMFLYLGLSIHPKWTAAKRPPGERNRCICF
jgi:hypothetical protein